MPKALFLDRDGVINKENNYLHRIEDFEFIEGIFDLCRFFQNNEFIIIVITNQAGIGRGYYSEDDFLNLTRWMLEEFRKEKISIRKVYHCPFHPTEGIGEYRKDSFDRKPNPGMIMQARDDFALDLDSSILIGDKESDIEAGKNAGVGTNVLFNWRKIPYSSTKADIIIDSLTDLPKLLSFS